MRGRLAVRVPAAQGLDSGPAGGGHIRGCLYFSIVTRRLRLAACLASFSSQGRTLRGTVRLHDVGTRPFSRRHLVVGLGRAVAASPVEVA